MKLFRPLLLLLIVLPLLLTVNAHQLRPAIVSLEFTQNGSVNIKIQTNLESVMAEIGATHDNTDDAPQAEYYKELRQLSADQLEAKFLLKAESIVDQLQLKFDQQKSVLALDNILIPDVGDLTKARLSELFLSVKIPPSAQQVTWQYPEKFGNNVAHFFYEKTPEEKISNWLTKGIESPAFVLNKQYVPKSFTQVASEYTVLGYEHIVPKGLDHILFVLGLFLLSVRMKPLLLQVTAFTLAHSITLGLTIYGLISLPASVVEPLIALSIVYVGIENILVKELKPWRVLIVFLFGLLHGLGFAGVLSELGLPESDFATALIFFNVGVEAGQLSVILVSFMLVFWLIKDEKKYRQWVIIPVSAMISLVGLYWTIERVFL